MLPTEISCITQLALETWADMSQADIRSRISRPGKRFVAAFKRSRLLSQHLERFVELASLGECNPSSLDHSLLVLHRHDGRRR